MWSDEELSDVITMSETPGDEPPAPGSIRYEAILVKAMGAHAHTTRRRTTRWWAAAAAAVVVGVTASYVVLDRRESPTASAAILDAAANLGEIESLQGIVGSVDDTSTSETRVRVTGDNADVVTTTRHADGHVENLTSAIVDGFVYETVDGVTVKSPFEFAPYPGNYGDAAKAVLTAVLADAEPVEGGVETISGLVAQRYDVVMTSTATDRLSTLPATELAWFELEYPAGVERLSVWIADALILQIEVTHDFDTEQWTTRTTFSNFNADFRIMAPPGPYVENFDDE